MIADVSGQALKRVGDYFQGNFQAMASPCEVLVDTDDQAEAEVLLRIAEAEARRIESKFSRYRSDNIVHAINLSRGTPIEVDAETASLIDYSVTCYEMSDGMFDITSGVLRRIWKLDGGTHVPTSDEIRAVRRHIGWNRVTWSDRRITLPPDMEIDLGGIGKEYAVDRASALLALHARCSFLVNFGGDLFASGLRRNDRPWNVGIDDPARTGESAMYKLEISRAGIATSGDARRYVLWKGKRLGHILNPKTGRPVENAPRSVTVIGRTCLEAGTLSTLAYLKGAAARVFLEEQNVPFCIL